jgi:hypothetical protein
MNPMIQGRRRSQSWPSLSIALVSAMASVVAIAGLITQDHLIVSALAAPVLPVALGTVWRSMDTSARPTGRASGTGRRWFRIGITRPDEPSHVHVPRPQRGEGR